MRYVDPERLKDFRYESPEPAEPVIVRMEDESPAEVYFKEQAGQNPHNRAHVAFSMYCALSNDPNGRFREKLAHHSYLRLGESHRRALANSARYFPKS